jgi:hypothetical protein
VQRKNHSSFEAAKRELVNAGYVTAHSSPGMPECWQRLKDKRRFAVAREDRARSSVWHIVDYPGSPVVDRAEFDWLDAA